MISISLLPQEYRQLAQLKRRQTIILTVGILLFLVLLLLSYLMLSAVQHTQEHLENLLAQKEVVEQHLKTLTTYRDLYQQVTEQAQIIDKAKENRIDWISLLSTMSDKVPHGLWLTDFALTKTKQTNSETGSSPPSANEDKEIILSGGAWNHLLVSSFVEDLQSMPEFSALEWDFSRTAGDDTVRYSISGPYREASHD